MTEKSTPPEWPPNWKNVDKYPSPEDTSNQQWAWEFLRRNQNFQDAYTQYKANPTPSILCDIQDKFGIYVTSGESLSPDNPNSEISSPELYEFPIVLPKKINASKLLSRTLTAKHIDEAVVTFNLALSIDAQLDKAKKHLKELQQELKKKGVFPKKAQKNDQKFLKYLRILDALNCGEKTNDIIFVLQLYSTKLEFPDQHPSDVESMLKDISDIDIIQRQTRADIKAAKELCDKNYTSLLDTVNLNDPEYMVKLNIKEYK